MMKRLKTILALVLALAMTASLAACGGSDTTEEPADDTALSLIHIYSKTVLCAMRARWAVRYYPERS